MKREEIGYSIKPEQFANGITRKKVTQTGCVHKRKNNGLMRQIEENYKKKESRKFFSEIKKLKQQNAILPYICVNVKTTLSSLKRIKS